MVGLAAKFEAVAHLQAAMGLSEHRACSFVGTWQDGPLSIFSSARGRNARQAMRPCH
jgi:hypothetical protein